MLKSVLRRFQIVDISDKVKYIQVLTTNRERNTAYVAESYRFMFHLEEIQREDKWFNSVYPLDVIEYLFRCTFSDGNHPYVQGLVNAQVLDTMTWQRRQEGWKS